MTIKTKIMAECNLSSHPINTPFIYKKESNFEFAAHGTANPPQCPLISDLLSLTSMALATENCRPNQFSLCPCYGSGEFLALGCGHLVQLMLPPIMYKFQKRASLMGLHNLGRESPELGAKRTLF